MFGLGRPQPSSAEKIAAAEQEMDLVTDMFNKYVSPSALVSIPRSPSPPYHSNPSIN
jgi:import inner membrane translocase subunit TIM10